MAQRLERLVQEDLNVGTGIVWVTAQNGGELASTQVGMHTFALGQKEYTASWTPGAITAGSKASTTLTVSGAAVGDFVLAAHDKILTSDLRISAHVSAADTVKVVIHNPTASSVTVAAGTVSVLVFNVYAPQAVLPQDGAIALVQWIVVVSGGPPDLICRVWMTDPTDDNHAGYYARLTVGSPNPGEVYGAKSGSGTSVVDIPFTAPDVPTTGTNYTVNVQASNAYGIRSLNTVTKSTTSP